MGIPQVVYLVLIALSLGISISDHGKVRVKQENCVTSIIAAAIQLAVLYWGGFFD